MSATSGITGCAPTSPVEYRGKANFHGFDIINNGGVAGSDEYRGSKSEWLVLANVYVDLGTWYSLTPFVGAGIGVSRNTISNFMDINTPTGGVAFGDSASKWNFAWAAHAGVSYQDQLAGLVRVRLQLRQLGRRAERRHPDV